jgi:plastocyanin
MAGAGPAGAQGSGARTRRRSRSRAAPWAVAALALVCAGCGSGGSASPPAAGAADVTVTLRDVAFNPARLSVRAGQTVLWRWADGGVPHNVDFGAVTSGDPTTSGTYRRTFPAPGAFPYRCDVHDGMKGTVVVG